MAAVKGRDTGPEMLVRSIVRKLGFRCTAHDAALPGTPDLVFKKLRKIINVHGCFWHMHDCGRCRIPQVRRAYWKAKLLRNVERDKRVGRELRALGWKTLTLWECQLGAAGRAKLLRRIAKFLGDPQPARRPAAKKSPKPA